MAFPSSSAYGFDRRPLSSEQDEQPLPRIDRYTLEWLEKKYPPRCIDEKETMESAQRYAGKVELIRELKIMVAMAEDQAHGVR